MENPRPEKVAVVEEVRERLRSSSGAILTEYRGLKVGDMATLRRSLRQAGGEYKVYKNTLVRFAARDLGLEDLVGLLEGPTAIAFVDGDAAQVAKALRDFSRTNPALIVKGGLLGGNILSAERTSALAELPSREVLLARLAGGLAAPLQQLAGLLQALPRNLAYGLKALIDQGGAPGAPAAEPTPATEAAPPAETATPAAEAAVEEPAAAADTTAEPEQAAVAEPEPAAEAEPEPAAAAEPEPAAAAEPERAAPEAAGEPPSESE